jgi:hypothetical protein
MTAPLNPYSAPEVVAQPVRRYDDYSRYPSRWAAIRGEARRGAKFGARLMGVTVIGLWVFGLVCYCGALAYFLFARGESLQRFWAREAPHFGSLLASAAGTGVTILFGAALGALIMALGAAALYRRPLCMPNTP